MKSLNILVNQHNECKLSDFGFAKLLESNNSNNINTRNNNINNTLLASTTGAVGI